MKTLTTISSSVLFGTLAVGCGEDGILLAEILASSGDPRPPVYEPGEPHVDEPTNPPGNPIPQNPPPEVERAEVEEILLNRCGDCHTEDPDTASGSLSNIDDIDALITGGFIVPGDREQSLVYVLMENGAMPPAFIRDNRPTAEDIEIVGAAIDAL
jgi:hypothetical protein